MARDSAAERYRSRRRAEENGRASAIAKGPEPWPAFIPLAALPAVPPFPFEVLPDWQSVWARATATATQTPPDLPGCLVLGVSAGALARRVKVSPRAGWTEPVNIFTTVALPAGDRKSAVFRAAMEPVDFHESVLREQEGPRIAELASTRRVLEKRLLNVETKAGKEDDADERRRLAAEAREVAEELGQLQAPDPTQLYCDDVTSEKLSSLIFRQGGRMLVAAAEGTCLEIAKGRYSEAANVDVYLKGHAGDPLRVGRVGRDGEMVNEPALTLALAVQPDVIRGLMAEAHLKGRGFLARSLYSVPNSLVGSREIAPAPVPEAVSHDYRIAMVRLWQLEPSYDKQGQPVATVLAFATPAQSVLRDFETTLEPRLGQDGDLSPLAGWGSKLAGAVVRLAGILHVAEHHAVGSPWNGPINRDTVEAAIKLGEYFTAHAKAAFCLMGSDDEVDDAQAVLRWILRERRTDFKRHMAFNDLRSKGRFPKVESLDPALDRLTKHGYVRHATHDHRDGPGRKPEPIFEVRPELGADTSGPSY